MRRSTGENWEIPRGRELTEAFRRQAEAECHLGWLENTAWLALDCPVPQMPSGDGWAWWTLRQVVGLGDKLFSLAARGRQLLRWRADHRFCGRCATPTEGPAHENALRCPACGLTHYPRIAPAIIVRVTRADHILLSRAPRFRPGMYSVQAGFVEAGENLEQALHRELWEELAIRVDNPRYFGSQTWPFPHSLMLAFTADYRDGELRLQPGEVEAAAWFRADRLPELPPPGSIARRLVDDWRAPG